MPSPCLARAVFPAVLAVTALVPVLLPLPVPAQTADPVRSPAAPPSGHGDVTLLDPIVVTATRSPETIDRLVSDIAVVDVAPGAPGLALTDLLRATTGAQLWTSGGPASNTGLSLRGADTGHTLTLIDGFRVGSASLGQTTFEALPIDHADRIEVLRGPASSLYGADAVGGVIQLLTREPQPGLAGIASAAFGQESTRQLRAGVEGGSERVRGRIRLGQDRSDGFDATTPGYFGANPDRDGYRRDGVSAQAEAIVGPQTRLRATALQNRLEADFDDGAFAGAKVKTRLELLGLSASHAPDAVSTVEAKLGRSRDRSESLSSFPGRYDTTLTQYGISGSRLLLPGIAARLVLERLEERVDSDGYAGTRAERTTNSVGVVLTGDSGPHRLQAGARLDDSSQYGGETHFSLAYGHRLGDGLRIGASTATAFHAPSFNDLYFPNYGRPGIRPETARNSELGLWWNPPAERGPGAGRWHGRLVAFHSKVKDLIVYAPACPDPDPRFAFGCADNVDRARIRGLSLAIGRRSGGTAAAAASPAQRDGPLATDRASGLAWSVNLELLDPEDAATGNRLVRRAARQLTAVVDYGVGPWRVGADLVTAGARFDDAANQDRLGGYAVINLRAAWRLGADLEVFGSIVNLADRDYATARHYRQQGRLILAGLRYAMR